MSHEPTKKSSIAAVYAAALYDSAAAVGSVADVLDDMESLRALLEAKSGLMSLLSAETISSAEKLQILVGAFGACLNPLTMATLRSMAHRDRLELFPEFVTAVVDVHHQRCGRTSVHIFSAAPLTPEQTSRIESQLNKKYGSQVMLKISIVPELIAGIQIKIGDTFIDGSARQRLSDLKASIKHALFTDLAENLGQMVLP